MNLISEYIEAILKIDEIEDEELDNKKVRLNNKLANRLRKIAFEIENKYPEMKPTFCKLLTHENSSVRIWVAHHVLEVMSCSSDCRRNALQEIIIAADEDSSIDGLGNRMWLENWLFEHPADKNLL